MRHVARFIRRRAALAWPVLVIVAAVAGGLNDQARTTAADRPHRITVPGLAADSRPEVPRANYYLHMYAKYGFGLEPDAVGSAPIYAIATLAPSLGTIGNETIYDDSKADITIYPPCSGGRVVIEGGASMSTAGWVPASMNFAQMVLKVRPRTLHWYIENVVCPDAYPFTAPYLATLPTWALFNGVGDSNQYVTITGFTKPLAALPECVVAVKYVPLKNHDFIDGTSTYLVAVYTIMTAPDCVPLRSVGGLPPL